MTSKGGEDVDPNRHANSNKKFSFKSIHDMVDLSIIMDIQFEIANRPKTEKGIVHFEIEMIRKIFSLNITEWKYSYRKIYSFHYRLLVLTRNTIAGLYNEIYFYLLTLR
jgi:hypothetical protein